MKLVSYCADMWTNMDDENDLTPFLSTILFTNASPSQTYSPLPLCCLRRVTRRRVSSCASLGATESRRSRRPPALGTHAHELGAGGGAVLETGRYPLGTPITCVSPFVCGGSSGLLLLLLLLVVAVLRWDSIAVRARAY